MEITLKEYTIKTNPPINRCAVIVTTQKGYNFWINHAEPFPTKDEAKELWKSDRKSFEPYYGQVGY